MKDSIINLALWRGLTPQHEWKYGFPTSFHATLEVEGIETWDGERHGIMNHTVGVFTGKLDCDGVKIFTGDRVEYFDSSKHSRTYTVMYHDMCFYLHLTQFDEVYKELNKIESRKLKVVGNIYEYKV